MAGRAPRHPVCVRREKSSCRSTATPARLSDLSITGCQLLSPTALKPNHTVKVTLPDGKKPVTCTGTVVWTRLEPSAGGQAIRYRAGVRFTKVDEAAIETFASRHGATPRALDTVSGFSRTCWPPDGGPTYITGPAFADAEVVRLAVVVASGVDIRRVLAVRSSGRSPLGRSFRSTSIQRRTRHGSPRWRGPSVFNDSTSSGRHDGAPRSLECRYVYTPSAAPLRSSTALSPTANGFG